MGLCMKGCGAHRNESEGIGRVFMVWNLGDPHHNFLYSISKFKTLDFYFKVCIIRVWKILSKIKTIDSQI